MRGQQKKSARDWSWEWPAVKGGHNKSKRLKGFTQQNFQHQSTRRIYVREEFPKAWVGWRYYFTVLTSQDEMKKKERKEVKTAHTPTLKQPSEDLRISLLLGFMQEKSLQSWVGGGNTTLQFSSVTVRTPKQGQRHTHTHTHAHTHTHTKTTLTELTIQKIRKGSVFMVTFNSLNT